MTGYKSDDLERVVGSAPWPLPQAAYLLVSRAMCASPRPSLWVLGEFSVTATLMGSAGGPGIDPDVPGTTHRTSGSQDAAEEEVGERPVRGRRAAGTGTPVPTGRGWCHIRRRAEGRDRAGPHRPGESNVVDIPRVGGCAA